MLTFSVAQSPISTIHAPRPRRARQPAPRSRGPGRSASESRSARFKGPQAPFAEQRREIPPGSRSPLKSERFNQWPPSPVRLVPPSSSTETNRVATWPQRPMESLGEHHWLRPSHSGVWASAPVTLEPKSPRRRHPGAAGPALLRCSNLPHPPPSEPAPQPPPLPQGPGAHFLAARR